MPKINDNESVAEQLHAATLPKLTTNEKAVLRWVRAGDPFRDKANGLEGRRARLRTLERLAAKGVIRLGRRDQLWKITVVGNTLLRVDLLQRARKR